MDKNALRKEMKQRRDCFDKKMLAKFDEILYNKIISGDYFKNAETIMLYSSFGSEPSTEKLIRHCLEIGKKVCLPVVDKLSKTMEAHLLEDISKLKISNYGIAEPISQKIVDKNTLDLIIVPGIAFGKDGHRLGYGAGYYDKFLAGISAIKLGICYHFCLVEGVYNENHDIKMDAIITNEDIMEF